MKELSCKHALTYRINVDSMFLCRWLKVFLVTNYVLYAMVEVFAVCGLFQLLQP
jgi:hypothetical protein